MLPLDKPAPAAAKQTGALTGELLTESLPAHNSTMFILPERSDAQRVHRVKIIEMGGTL